MRRFFHTEQWFPFPRPAVFAFFADPRNLPPLMPGWQQARIDEVMLKPPEPHPGGSLRQGDVAAGSGTRLLITARVAPGLPARLPWLALIEDFHWDDHFCDLQLKGPFAYWRHCHSVRDGMHAGQAGTVVRDEVEYELPLTPLSTPATPFGDLAMRSLFAFRQRRATQLVPGFARAREG